MNTSKFLRYLQLKSKHSFVHRGYDVGKIISQIYNAIAYECYKPKFKDILKIFFFKDFKALIKCDKEILLTYGKFKTRKDYYELVDYVANTIEGLHYYVDLNYLKTRLTFNLRNIVKSWQMAFKMNELPLKSKLLLFSETCFYLNTIYNLEKIDLVSVKKYLATDSINYHEAILTQYFKLRAVPTYTLQHGIISYLKDDPPIEAIMYENMFSDYHLCWGGYTRDQYMLGGVSEEKLIIAGYPRKINQVQFNLDVKDNSILVMLSRELYHHSNLNVIDVLAKAAKHFLQDYSFVFKLHPSLNFDYYNNSLADLGFNYKLIGVETTITNLLTENAFKFSVAVNTTAYFEAYIYRVACLQYKDNSFDLMPQIDNDDFTDYNSFEDKVKKILSLNSSNDYWGNVDKKLNYILGYGINNYNDILK